MSSAAPSRITIVMGETAGGIGRHVASLVPELTNRGADVEVLGPSSTRWFMSDQPEMFRVIPAPSSVFGVVRAGLALRKMSKGRDLIHAHGLRAGVAAIGAVAFRRSPKLVVTVHNALLGRGKWTKMRWRIINRLLLRSSTRVAYVSKDLLPSAGAPAASKAIVVPAGATVALADAGSAQAARESLGSKGGGTLILAVGRLHRQKGFDVLIRAAPRMTVDDFSIVIAGDGPERASLESAIASERQGARVHLLGDRSDARALIASADVFCMPSRWEGSPLALHEALAAGRPIVAARVGGIPDMTGEDGALLVAPEDPGALAQALDSIASDPELRRRLSDAAVTAGMRWPDAAATAARIAGLYEEVLGRSLGSQIQGSAS